MGKLANRGLVAVVLFSFIFATSGCGTILYPERHFSPGSGKPDLKVIGMDCLWLLVGVIPGLVALLVDLGSGAIFLPQSEVSVSPGETVRINIPGPAPADCEVTVRLYSPEGEELVTGIRAQATQGKELDAPLSLTIPSGRETSGARLVLAVDGREQASWTLCHQ